MPNFINKTIVTGILLAALFTAFPVHAQDSAQSEDKIKPTNNIQFFNEKFTISGTVNYSAGTFTHEDMGYSTDRTWYVGLGFRYKNISASFSIPVPFKTTSFDIDFNPYFDTIYYHAYIKYHKDFNSNKTNEASGLDVLSSAVMATYVVNHENHSLSSIMNLDKKQTVSNGSLLYSFGTFFSSIYSTDEAMIDYNKNRQNIFYFGPGIGYSYTWVLENAVFLNLSMVIFTNLGINTNTKDLSLVPQFIPQFLFGQHHKTWSFNVKIANNSEFILKGLNFYDILTFNSISAIVSKRF